MAVNVRHREDVVILELSGKIFGTAALEFKRVFDEQIASCTGTPKFLIDFCRCHNIGQFRPRCLNAGDISPLKNRGGLLALVNVGSSVQNLMIQSRLIEQFEPFESEEKAMEALNAE